MDEASVMNRHLVVMVKEPRPGRVKTRLGKDMGMTSAAWWFRHQTALLLRRLDTPRWNLWLAVSPDYEGMKSRVWPSHLPRIAQGQGDLGMRMARLFNSFPPGPVCIIGGDIPGVFPRHVDRAFRALGRHDVVFGPAVDGGYWLVGMKRTSGLPAGLFDGVRWSSRRALEDSIATLGTDSVAIVDELQDVDTLSDLNALSK